MLRYIISAITLVSVLATVLPASADLLAATASDHAKAAAPVDQQSAPPAPARSAPLDAMEPAPSSARFGKDIIPVGFGWG